MNLKYSVDFYVDDAVYATVGTNGEEIGMPIDPVKEDETFDGWYLDEGIWKKPFTVQSLLDQPLKEDISLKVYARWKRKEFEPDFTLTGFTKEDGVYRISLPNATAEINFNDCVSGEGFVWTASKDSDFAGVSENGIFRLSEGDNIFYIKTEKGEKSKIFTATVRRRPVYIVSFDVRGGTPVSQQSVEEGGFVDEKAAVTTKDGCSFLRWDKDVSSAVTSSVTFAAVWQGENFIVSFNPDGGIMAETQKTVVYGEDFSLPVPERQGYKFLGWFDGETVWNSDAFGKPENKSIKAKWEFENYTISYVLNGGNNVLDNVSSYTVADGDILLHAPQRSGAEFDGWYTDKNYGKKISRIESGSTGDITLYAKWTLIEYSVVYHFDGGERRPEFSFPYPEVYTIDSWENIWPACKEDYMFGGWYDNADFTGEAIEAILPGRTRNIEFWAKWQYGTEGLMFQDNGNGGYDVIGLSEWANKLLIPSEYNSRPVVAIRGLSYKNDIKRLEICEGVREIEESAFEACENLTFVSIPSTIERIGERAFFGCTGLKDLYFNAAACEDFPKDRGNVFSQLEKYEYEYNNEHRYDLKVTVGKAVKSLPANFLSFTRVSDVNFEENGVIETFGANAFQGVRINKAFVLPQTLKAVGNQTFYFSSFTRIVLPSGLETIGDEAFSFCSGFSEITIPLSVGFVGNGAFKGDSILLIRLQATTVNEYWNVQWNVDNCAVVLDCDNNDVAEDGYIYVYDDGLRFRVKDGEAEFMKQSSKTENVTVPNEVEYHSQHFTVTAIQPGAFHYSVVVNVVLPSFLEEVTPQMFEGCEELKTVTLGTNTVSIGSGAFAGCCALEIIIGTENVTQVALGAFSSCESLISLNLPKVDVVPDSMCFGDTSLTSIILSPTLKEIGNSAFSSCGITEMSFPETLTKIGFAAFRGAKIQSAILPDSLTELGGWAFWESALSSIRLPSGLTSVPSSSFARTPLTKVELPASVTKIEFSAFQYCDYLTEVIFNEGLKTIENDVFESSGLKKVVLPSTVTTIGGRAFMNNRFLERVDIPVGVTSIGWEAFYGCSSLASVLLHNTLERTGENAFEKCENLTVYTDSAWYKNEWHLGTSGAIFYKCTLSDDGTYLLCLNKIGTSFDNVYSSSKISAPVRDGYSFGGWYLNPALESTRVTDLSTVAEGSRVFAKWIAVE